MQVKFNKSLEEYHYILGFDLAKYKTGFSVLDIKTQKVVYVGNIHIETQDNFVWDKFYNAVKTNIIYIQKNYGYDFFVIKERLPNQGGPRSNIAALQELAKAHAVFDLLITQMGLDYYDYDGIHAVSVKSYFKNRFSIEKPTKEDIFGCIRELNSDFVFPENDFDITDSVAVSMAFLCRKWNHDINEKIKELKKEMRELKTKKSILEKEKEISRLEKLRN